MAFPLPRTNIVLTTAAFFIATTAFLTYYSASTPDDNNYNSKDDYYNYNYNYYKHKYNYNTNTPSSTPPSTPTGSSIADQLTDDDIVDLLWREWNAQARCALLLVERQMLTDQMFFSAPSSPTIINVTPAPLRSAIPLPVLPAAAMKMMMTTPNATATKNNKPSNKAATTTTSTTTTTAVAVTTNQKAKAVLAADPELRETLEDLAERTHGIPELRGGAVPEGVDWQGLFLLDEDPVPIAKAEAKARARAMTAVMRGRTKERGGKAEGRLEDGGDEVEEVMMDLGLLLDVCFRGLLG